MANLTLLDAASRTTVQKLKKVTKEGIEQAVAPRVEIVEEEKKKIRSSGEVRKALYGSKE